MRDRVWRYLVAPQAYDWFGDTAAEMARLGFTRHLRPPPKDRYYLWLHKTTFASSPVRYARVTDDVRSDLDMMPATLGSICSVEQVDRQRGIAAKGLAKLDERTRQAAETRQQENRAAIGWFVEALRSRYASYSFALDHLLVETPHDAAMATDAALSELEVYVEIAQNGDFCSGRVMSGSHSAAAGVSSRYQRIAAAGTGS